MKDAVLVSLGQKIRDLRKLKGISQEQLGEMAGFHFSYIGGIERAEKNISILNLKKIATALDVTVNELFVYGGKQRRGQTEKDQIINSVIEKLISMSPRDIRKIDRIIDELFT